MTFKRDHFNLIEKLNFKITKRFLSEESFSNLSMQRWLGYGDVKNPKTFNEKLHWLRIHHFNHSYSIYADKISVREIIKDKIGENHLNKIYKIWSSPNEVNFKDLPKSFVIKCSHGSGMNIIIHDKNKTSQKEIINKLKKWFQEDFSKRGREYIYKIDKKKIFAEKFLAGKNSKVPLDYKIYCFNGEPKIIHIDIDRFVSQKRILYDINWKRIPCELLHESPEYELEKPKKLNEMIEISKRLSKDFPFVRVDLYSLPEIVFGELTFIPGSGTEPFRPINYDLKIGNLLDISKITKKIYEI